MFDILIKNAVIIDGSGDKRYNGEIGICGDKIAKIAPSITDEAKEIIDAKGQYCLPRIY